MRPARLAATVTNIEISSQAKTGQLVAPHTDLTATLGGHSIAVTFGLGDSAEDRHIDRAPWSNTHLKIESEGHVITSFGLVVTKASVLPAS